MFHPPKGAAKAVPYGVNLTSFLFNNCPGNDFDTFNLQTEIRFFEILKMFHPPMGFCKAEPNGVHFDSFNFVLV